MLSTTDYMLVAVLCFLQLGWLFMGSEGSIPSWPGKMLQFACVGQCSTCMCTHCRTVSATRYELSFASAASSWAHSLLSFTALNVTALTLPVASPSLLLLLLLLFFRCAAWRS
jgi:hypothetical protein